MRFARNVAIILLLLLSGCANRQELHPRLLLQTEWVAREFWFTAPHVLVVKILAFHLVGRPIHFTADGKVELQLVKFTANVENHIAGPPIEKEIEFYFFAKPDQRPRYLLRAGKRYVVSLRKEDGIYRSMADASQLNLELNSGRHEQSTLPLTLGVGPVIAYLLYTPGEGCDLRVFAEELSSAPHDDLASLEYVGSLVDRLLLHPDENIRDSACIGWAGATLSNPPCLQSAVVSTTPKIRERARQLLSPEGRIDVARRLKNDPLSLMPYKMGTYLVGSYAAWTLDLNPEVRALACAQLKTLAPNRSFPGCRQPPQRP